MKAECWTFHMEKEIQWWEELSISRKQWTMLWNDALYVFRYRCNPGIKMEGSDTVVCTGNSWNGTVPNCNGKSSPFQVSNDQTLQFNSGTNWAKPWGDCIWSGCQYSDGWWLCARQLSAKRRSSSSRRLNLYEWCSRAHKCWTKGSNFFFLYCNRRWWWKDDSMFSNQQSWRFFLLYPSSCRRSGLLYLSKLSLSYSTQEPQGKLRSLARLKLNMKLSLHMIAKSWVVTLSLWYTGR